MYYASIGVLSLIIQFIINFEALKNRNSHRVRLSQVRYRHFLYAVMLFYIADILWGYLYEQRWLVPTYIDTMIFFISMGASVLLWTRFVVAFIDNKGCFGTLLMAGGWMIFSFQLVTLIINFFTPIFFEFLEDDEYKTGPVRYLSLVLQMILFIVVSIYTLSVTARVKGEARAHHRTIGFSGIVMSLFILLQCQYPLMPFYSIGCLLATCIIHSFVYLEGLPFRCMHLCWPRASCSFGMTETDW